MKTVLKLTMGATLILILVNSCSKDPLLIASDFFSYFDEHPSEGKIIGTLYASSGEGKLSFSLKSSSPEGALAIDQSTGVLSVSDPLLFDYETTPVITGEVKVVCEGTSRTLSLKIMLNDIELIAGNNTKLGFSDTPNLSSGYLMGTKQTLNGSGKLRTLNLIGRNTGASVKMAVYSDNNGVPGNLVATSAAGIVNNWGIVSIPVNETVALQAGNYWIMAVYNSVGTHTYFDFSSTEQYFTSLAFANAPPANGSGFSHFSGGDITYFMVVD